MVGHESFACPAVFPIEAHNTDLTGEACTAGEYAIAGKVVDAFGLVSFGYYHDVYLGTDVLAFVDCFEAFRDVPPRERLGCLSLRHHPINIHASGVA